MKNFLGMGKQRRNREPPPRGDWPAGLVILDTSGFDDFIEKYPVILVDFYSPTCGPCMAMAPTIRKLSRQYRHRVAFAKVNIAEHQELAKRYRIMSIPNIVIFSYGKKVNRLVGKRSESGLKKALDRALSDFEE